MVSPTPTELILEAAQKGIVQPRMLAGQGVTREHFRRLVKKGVLERIHRGFFRLAHLSLSEHHDLAVAAAAVPEGVVCLLSALAFHEMGTQSPTRVWMFIPQQAATPRRVSLKIIRGGLPVLRIGIEHHTIEGASVRITTPARTVVDCFRFRNRLGVGIAVEALRAYRTERRGSLDELVKLAGQFRMARIMRPYLEALG
jgi:predicted transcriptional regulator of viral defense system